MTLKPGKNAPHFLKADGEYVEVDVGIDEPDAEYVKLDVGIDERDGEYAKPDVGIVKLDGEYAKPGVGIVNPDEKYAGVNVGIVKVDVPIGRVRAAFPVTRTGRLTGGGHAGEQQGGLEREAAHGVERERR